jgi:toxin CptA
MSRSRLSRLRIGLTTSRRLAGLLLGSHALAAAGLLASRPSGAIATVGLLALALSLALCLRRHACVSTPQSVVRFELTDTLEFEAETHAGDRVAGTVLGTTFVTPWLVVINVQREGRRLPLAVVILPDATDRESYRALRVWLRWRQADARDR